MDLKFLDFEQPIAELEAKIEQLRFVGDDSQINISGEIERLKGSSKTLTKKIFSHLTSWQITQLARHPQRPYTLDYLDTVFTDFQELHGDRMYADDEAMVGGLARLEGILGRQEEALRYMQQAAVLDPLDWGIQFGLASAYAGTEQFDQSLEILRRVREMDPGRSGTHYRFGRNYLRADKPGEALEEFKLETFDFLSISGQAMALDKLGKTAQSQSQLNSLITTIGESASYQIAQVYAQRGDADSAMTWLERGFVIRDPGLVYLKSDKTFDPVRSDPRFQSLLEKMHLAD
jgi:tetratricopeptide (TPR) repeat protein